MKRIDRTKKFLWQVILFNKRLAMYEYYIRLAQENGYKVCSMEEFWEDKDSACKHFILRHDVDHVSKGVRRMYEVEKKCGVKSTYYFRHSTLDIPLMKEMQENGFEVGLHFETLADYADEKNLTEVGEKDFEICKERLKKEIVDFQALLPKKIFSICSHGAERNSIIGYSNNVLTEGIDYAEYGIGLEAYDKELYEKYLDVHITDATFCINYGFSYEVNPIEAIGQGKENILFLTHPNHWHQDFMRSVKDIAKLILHKNYTSSVYVFGRLCCNHKETEINSIRNAFK